jgi:hypothetical protein
MANIKTMRINIFTTCENENMVELIFNRLHVRNANMLNGIKCLLSHVYFIRDEGQNAPLSSKINYF